MHWLSQHFPVLCLLVPGLLPTLLLRYVKSSCLFLPKPDRFLQITAPSIDSSLPTLQASFFRESEQSDMVPRLYINKAPLPTGDADIHSDNGLIPRGRNRKDPKSSKATTSKAHMLTTTVTFGTTAFASEQTDSYGDITGDKKSTYYLKFTDELPVSHCSSIETPITLSELVIQQLGGS